MAKKLTIKQKGFCKDMITAPDATTAAYQNYNVSSRNAANVIAVRNLNNPKINREIERLMEELNVTDELMMQRLREGLDAKVVTNYKGDASETEIADLDTRHKWWQDAAKIMDYYPPDKTENRNVNIDIELEKMSPEQISSLINNLAKQYDTRAKENPRKSSGGDKSPDSPPSD